MSPARDGLLFTHGYDYDRDPAAAVERVLDLCARAASIPGGYDGGATVTVGQVLRAVAIPKASPVEHIVSAAHPEAAMNDDPGDAIQDDLGAAIDRAVTDHEHGLVTRWVALVESVAPDGTRGLWTMTSRDVMAWDTVGILQHALHLQLAQTLRGDEP